MAQPPRLRILVTGAEGFVGRFLVPFFTAQGADVVSTALNPAAASHLHPRPRPLDILDAPAVQAMLTETKPTHLLHLAAVSSVRQSFADPQTTDDVNVRGTRVLLEAARALSPTPRVFLIGSGDEYGPNAGTPLPELPLSDLHPVSPYGKSKKAVEEIVEATPAYLAMTIRTRSFPHIGPGQSAQFFLPEVAAQIVRVERGQQSPVVGVGNLSAIRDFTDVRDVVRAYWLLLEKGVPGAVYNVCSGVPVTIQDLLQKMIALSGITIRVEQDPAKVRPVDVPALVGNNAKMRQATGWSPEIPIERTLKDVLEHQRGQPT
jgi:GDP-4-dehydro-6-deoxy-D-mannose reductase